MFSGLLIILLPLVIGYLIPLHRPSALKLITRLLSWIVYVILFFMGISGLLDNLASNLTAILHYAAVSVVIIMLCNIAALMWLEQKMPRKIIIVRKDYPRVWQWRWNPFSYAAWCLLAS